jgi:hypothetical protein
MKKYKYSVGETIQYRNLPHKIFSRIKSGGKNRYLLMSIQQSNSFVWYDEEEDSPI